MHDAAAPIFSFDNLYARLPERFFTAIAPTPVRAPRLIKVNDGLARELGLDPEALASPRGVAILAGNHVPEGADPLAQAYAGHQFGGFSPRLGDGRAILLGEVIDRAGRRRDIQLKGSGPTPYSRGGDGRAGLGPVLREYLVAEGMHALGVPTTRALAAVTTGEPIFRESPEPGAILTRVAASHLRVGTLEYFAARSDHEALTVLVDHALARHYPAASGPLGLLEGVRDAQAALVAAWMALGFIHGVMNTDNTTLSGETIDYGPCAFLDTYDPRKVFSSIDHRGRYAYSNQPGIMLWNLSRLADALLPVIDPDEDKAIAAATAILEGFAPRFEAAWLAAFRRKLGLLSERDGDPSLAADLLELMAQGRADFTRTFRGLADGRAREEFENPAAFDAWVARWRQRLADEGSDPEARAPALRQANPALIPRNHRIEAAIVAAKAGDHGPFEALLAALSRPYDDPEDRTLMTAPRPEEEVKATFCGT